VKGIYNLAKIIDMKFQIFSRFVLMASMLMAFAVSYAQFEGVIDFRKIKTDTIAYKYFVRGNKVRIEEFGQDGSLKGIMLVDLDKGTVVALNTERKLYMDVTNTRNPNDFTPVISKTNNEQEILGYKCREWIVTDKVSGTKTSYWVGGDNFDFFKPLLSVLNRKDNLPVFFLKIPGNEHVFPFIGIDSAVDGKVRIKLETLKVEPQHLRASLFVIPKDYTKFEN